MKLIALDFDGVLVPEQSHFYWKHREGCNRAVPELQHAQRCCPIAISNLNYVCEQVLDVRIIISSTWRKYFSIEDLKAILIEDGFRYTDRIIGMTPSIPRGLTGQSNRGEEIEQWIEGSKEEVEVWVAIDDHSDNNINPDHLILTMQETGFTIIHAYELIERFKPGWIRPVFLM